ncbi:MAG: hypothetical protein HOF74_08200 [Gammaproteobacteria bacterium]|jgi:hypothetical protein|nr:hypothetical protein [Gammaproteobacteria bacterium]MBT3859795.1 hypothetical protein [Gammaproteobacteria bacterium]MBT3988810.1 hypothetical protein [Gammaproteobacteria bacterium]MBT4254849.1 hypothetical protein [Gammaproteobacteria bacterium]MBT4580909.1 hypothetical protein [Gammaproteobacteria bacterium]
MKKAVWITFAIALVVVNLFAEGIDYYAGVEIIMFYRIVMVLSITVVASVFVGAMALVGALEGEKPLSGNVRDTLGADKKVDPAVNKSDHES